MTSAGVWIYTLNNAHPAVQALNVGGTLNDSFTVTTIDGTPQLVTITIAGTNDAAVLSSDTVNLAETNAVLSTGGTLSVGDIDSPGDLCRAGRHGRALRHIRHRDRRRVDLVDGFGAQRIHCRADLYRNVLGIERGRHHHIRHRRILGSNDAASISGTSTGAVLEAGGAKTLRWDRRR